MVGLAYANAVMIDTSAVVALLDPADQFHQHAADCLAGLQAENLMCAVDVTAHEVFTTLRYNVDLDAGVDGFGQLREAGVRTLDFTPDDEQEALALARKYTDKALSFHDVLCAAVMLRYGMFRVFSFDADFWTFGFELVPGITGRR